MLAFFVSSRKKAPRKFHLLVLKYRGNRKVITQGRSFCPAKLLHPLRLNLGSPVARFRRGNIGVDMGIGDAGECRHTEFFDLPSPRQVNLTGKCGSRSWLRCLWMNKT